MFINRLRSAFGAASLVIVTVLALGACSSNRVWVKIPPQQDLSGYARIGLIEFNGNDPSLTPQATRQFQQEVQSAQPGVRIVELGNESWLLGSVGRPVLDGPALEEIADEHGLDALFIGELEVSKATPRIDMIVSLFQIRGSVDVTADMHVRLVEAPGGATVWSRSSSDTVSIAHGGGNSAGSGHISVTDPESVYAPMMSNLATWVTAELRPRFVRRKIEQVPPHYVIEYADGSPVYAPPRQQRATASVPAEY